MRAGGPYFTKTSRRPPFRTERPAKNGGNHAIALYLAEGSPEKRLVPSTGTLARARLYERLNFLTSDLHKNFVVFQAVRGVIAQHLAYLDTSLAGRPFLLGDEFSIADAYLFTILG